MNNINLRAGLRVYLPSLLELVNESRMDWDNIESKFTERINEFIKNTPENGTIIVKTSLHEAIHSLGIGQPHYENFIDYLKKLFEELKINLSNDEVEKIQPILRGILIQFNESQFLHSIGELSVLNNLIKSGYKLINCEPKKSKGERSPDFKMFRIESKNYVFVEVLNIMIEDEKVEDDDDKIQTFFHGRFKNKIDTKSLQYEFFLVPVLWAGHETLRIYSRFFQKHTKIVENVIEPVSYLSFYNSEVRIHKFGRVSTLFAHELSDSVSTL